MGLEEIPLLIDEALIRHRDDVTTRSQLFLDLSYDGLEDFVMNGNGVAPEAQAPCLPLRQIHDRRRSLAKGCPISFLIDYFSQIPGIQRQRHDLVEARNKQLRRPGPEGPSVTNLRGLQSHPRRIDQLSQSTDLLRSGRFRYAVVGHLPARRILRIVNPREQLMIRRSLEQTRPPRLRHRMCWHKPHLHVNCTVEVFWADGNLERESKRARDRRTMMMQLSHRSHRLVLRTSDDG